MQFRRQNREDVSINLTPLIDVVFLLLIFFMVSTTFTRETRLDITLPEADSSPAVKPEDQVEVVVGSNGRYSVDGKVLTKSNADTLRSVLLRKAEQGTDIPFTITADAQASHQAVVRVMDVAGRIGFTNINITTRAPDQDSRS
jgi:biopolymer transport protein ExbD